MKKVISISVMGLGLVLLGSGAFAASDSGTLTINATVTATAKLVISPTTISFPDADPDTTPSISASSPVSVTAKVKTGASSTPTLTLLANGDLTSGTNSIGIGNVTWTAASPFRNGTMNKTTAQPVDDGWTGSGNRGPGNLNFVLANSWSYATGSYSQTATFTLTAP